MDSAGTDATNTTTAFCAACLPCTELSGGSAFFWIVALVLGLLAQPGGSLVTEPQLGDWRVWRLSPFLCGLEALAILFALARAVVKRKNFQKPVLHRLATRVRECAFALMAARTTAPHGETKPLGEYLGRPKLELILPMGLLFWKALFIRGVPLLTASAVMLGVDWALVQALHCTVWFWPSCKDKPRCCDNKGGRARNPVCLVEWTRFDDEVNVAALIRVVRMGGTVILSLQHVAQVMWFGYRMAQYYVAKEQAGYDNSVLRRSSSRFFGGIFVASVIWEAYIVMGDLVMTGGPIQDAIPTPTVLRALVPFAAFLGFFIHCKFFYHPAGTYKPDRLDWFG